MKMYDFACAACAARFEDLVRDDDDAPACPTCGSADTARVLSAFSVGGAARARPASNAPACDTGGCCFGGACSAGRN